MIGSFKVADLVAAGAPLAVTEARASNLNMSRAHLFYAHKVLDNTAQERLRTGLLPLKKDGQTRILSSAMAEFKTLPESKRVRHIAQARARSRSAPAVCEPRLDARCKDHSTGLFSQVAGSLRLVPAAVFSGS